MIQKKHPLHESNGCFIIKGSDPLMKQGLLLLKHRTDAVTGIKAWSYVFP